MPRDTVRLTMAQALVRYLCSQHTVIDGERVPLFAGVFAIFGHGNVTCLSEALEPVQDLLPTWRGQNEQSMALAAMGYAKAKRRRQIMIATSSIGPGALNMMTAAGAAPTSPAAVASNATAAPRASAAHRTRIRRTSASRTCARASPCAAHGRTTGNRTSARRAGRR